MCTVTLIPRPGGFRLVVNRDELHTRPAATPPHVSHHPPREAIYPVDPPSAGTWVAVNDAGLAFTLLNLKHRPGHGGTHAAADEAASPTSRGVVIPALLHHHDLREALDDASTLDAADFAPFRLMVVDDRHVGVLRCDGQSIETRCDPRPEEPMMLTSSGLGDHVVEPPRRALFDGWFSDDRGAWPDEQDALHRHRWPDRAEVSIDMHREDARTLSRTVIEVSPRRVEMRYTALPAEVGEMPCRIALARPAAVASPA